MKTNMNKHNNLRNESRLRVFSIPGTTKNLLGIFCIVLISIFLFFITTLSSIEIFFILFLFSIFFWNFEGRIAIAGGIFFLILSVILMLLSSYAGFIRAENWSEVVAIWAYYFLIIGILKQLTEISYKIKAKSKVVRKHGHTLWFTHTDKNTILLDHKKPKKPTIVTDVIKKVR